MAKQVKLSETYVMRDFHSSPVARALRIGARLSLRGLFLGAVLFLAIPSSGPDIPVRTIPDFTRIRNLSTLVSGPEADSGFSQFVTWVSPPRFNWDYFAGLDDFQGFDDESSDSDPVVAETVSDFDAPAPDTAAAAFFVPDSFGASGWDFTVPDGSFVLAAKPGFGTPEPRSSILIAIGMAGFALIALYRRKRQSGAPQRV
jgi:hypothetical protein